MSEVRAVVGRYLGSRKNIAGMAGAVAGAGLHLGGLVGGVWPVVAVGLYGVAALVAPGEPADREQQLTDVLRDDARSLATRVAARDRNLPLGAAPIILGMLDRLGLVLDRLDQVADEPIDRAAAPERLADALQIIRVDLPACVDTYLDRDPAPASGQRASEELMTQLDLIAATVDRLAGAVPESGARRAEDLTHELRRRYGLPPAPS